MVIRARNRGGAIPESLVLGLVADLASGVSATAAVATSVAALPVESSGVYTPVRSAEVNTDVNVVMSEAQWLRVGNTVTVSGLFAANPTLAATLTSFEMTLPVASNIGAVEDCAGVATAGGIAGMEAAIQGVAANDTAKAFWISSDITLQTWSYIFSYQVI